MVPAVLHPDIDKAQAQEAGGLKVAIVVGRALSDSRYCLIRALFPSSAVKPVNPDDISSTKLDIWCHLGLFNMTVCRSLSLFFKWEYYVPFNFDGFTTVAMFSGLSRCLAVPIFNGLAELFQRLPQLQDREPEGPAHLPLYPRPGACACLVVYARVLRGMAKSKLIMKARSTWLRLL